MRVSMLDVFGVTHVSADRNSGIDPRLKREARMAPR